jgi:eukaryotic-like serine/threonine-protein kinase
VIPSDAKQALLGGRFGRFQLVETMASGGMADLYRAIEHPSGRAAVVKVLRRGDAELTIRFRREAEIIRRLRCPHTVTLYDFGEEDEFLYIAMELLVGETVFDTVRRLGSMSAPMVVDVAEQVLVSLQEAHSLGVIHRDLKPENVFLVAPEAEGGSPGPRSVRRVFAKVLDFGLAKFLVGGREGVTAAGFTVGTPGYMSPEQLLGGSVDSRSDLFSLGVVLYQALTGEMPYEGTDVLSGASPRPWQGRRGSTSGSLEDLIVRALSSDPAKRPQDAREMLSELRKTKQTSLPQILRTSPAAGSEAPTERSELRALLAWRVEPELAKPRVVPSIERAVSGHVGRIERTGGEFGVASFGASPDAVAAAIEIGSHAAALRQKSGPNPQIRLAVHHGYIVSQGESLGGDSVAVLERVIERCGDREVLVTRGAFEEAKDILGLKASKAGICDSEIGHPIDLFRVGIQVSAQPETRPALVPSPTPREYFRSEGGPRTTPTSWPSQAVSEPPRGRSYRLLIAGFVFLIAAAVGVAVAFYQAKG